MELPSISTPEEIKDFSKENIKHDSLKLNNKLIKQFEPLHVYSKDVRIKDEKKFIISFYDKHDKLVLRAIYTVLGSFSKEKNVWVWANTSITINVPMKKEISHLRQIFSSVLKNEKIKQFVQNDHSILPTIELFNNLSYLSLIMTIYPNDNFTKMKTYSLVTLAQENIINVFIIKKILSDNTRD